MAPAPSLPVRGMTRKSGVGAGDAWEAPAGPLSYGLLAHAHSSLSSEQMTDVQLTCPLGLSSLVGFREAASTRGPGGRVCPSCARSSCYVRVLIQIAGNTRLPLGSSHPGSNQGNMSGHSTGRKIQQFREQNDRVEGEEVGVF